MRRDANAREGMPAPTHTLSPSLHYSFHHSFPTATNRQVVDFKNEGESGKGWTIGPDGLPKLPINSVLIVVGVGSLILEAASHAPVLGSFMPRVLQVGVCLAVFLVSVSWPFL